MRKQLFETKVKDGLWLLVIVAIVIVTSLSMDDVTGAFRRGKIRCVVYVPSYEVPSDGPSLKPGDGVKLYKQMVGRVLDVKFFVASVQKPFETESAPPPEAPPSSNKDPFASSSPSPAGSPSPSPSPVATPSPAAPAAGPWTPPPSRPDLISGLKIEVELFKGDYPSILALVTPDSAVKVESQTLGESSVLMLTSPYGRPVANGDRVNFPRNHVSMVNPADESSRWGKELATEAEVVAIREKIRALQKGPPPAEAKKNASDEF